jgi:hypothetical protein
MIKNKTSLVEAMSKSKNKHNENIDPAKASQMNTSKKIITSVSPEAHYQLKRLSVEQRSQIQILVKEALNDLFIKYKLPPIV